MASQGRPGFTDQGGWFVKTYTIAYSKDEVNWTNCSFIPGVAKVCQPHCLGDNAVSELENSIDSIESSPILHLPLSQ